MERKDRIDAFGAASLVGFSLLLGFGQVIIKVGNEGFGPVFFAGMRSALSLGFLLIWMRARGIVLELGPGVRGLGLLMGLFFTGEFVALFIALDLTTVARSALMFYTMPVWLALLAHFLLPGERLTVVKVTGLALAFAGVAMALLAGSEGGGALVGDLCALAGAWCWAGLALVVRGTRLREMRAESQLMWQLAVSAVLLGALAPLFGPLFRGPEALHWGVLLVQGLVISGAGFLFWLWILKFYPASSVASFGFLTPVFGTLLGWLILDEPLPGVILLALALVAAGLWLVNRPVGRVRVA
ncbi:DMT family transporter [Vannielia litorea]|uniref:Permease of the drug/metabolite transporter (DMT) superfamily n=1 Tax=Vannielia litorea TaxID=1217970 RepID=A0A1N6FQX2_9RHOB|nr:DMT family transporter [Vannielia litorea]SIN97669.1 Permease of the drug/metabolite transporter (DMT) superfamily [Vannielia litorea]